MARAKPAKPEPQDVIAVKIRDGVEEPEREPPQGDPIIAESEEGGTEEVPASTITEAFDRARDARAVVDAVEQTMVRMTIANVYHYCLQRSGVPVTVPFAQVPGWVTEIYGLILDEIPEADEHISKWLPAAYDRHLARLMARDHGKA